MNREQRNQYNGENLQKFFDIRLDDSPSKRPVNLEICVYAHTGQLKQKIVGTIVPKEPAAFGSYSPSIVNNAVGGWAIHNGYVRGDLGDVVMVECYPFGGLREENFDSFLRGHLEMLSISLGVRVHKEGRILALQSPVPRNDSLMAAELLALAQQYRKGPEARHARANFRSKWASYFNGDINDYTSLIGGMQDIAEAYNFPLEWWPAEDGHMHYRIGDYLYVNEGAEITIQAHNDSETVFSWGQLMQALEYVQDCVNGLPAPALSIKRDASIRSDSLFDIHDRIVRVLPSHWEVTNDALRILKFRRKKTLSNPSETVGTFTTCQDEDGLLYLVWECQRGLTFADEVGRMTTMGNRNYSIRREFRVHRDIYSEDFTQQILRDMEQAND